MTSVDFFDAEAVPSNVESETRNDITFSKNGKVWRLTTRTHNYNSKSNSVSPKVPTFSDDRAQTGPALTTTGAGGGGRCSFIEVLEDFLNFFRLQFANERARDHSCDARTNVL